MQIDGLRAADRFKALSIAERLFEISDGRLATRAGLAPMIGQLMMHVRDDCCPAGADEVLDRLLAKVDHRCGLGQIADLVLAEALQ